MAVPEIYCILTEMFDRKLGLSKAEFEFPIYYRYFVCRGKATIVTTEAFEERIRTALKETLFGPGVECNVKDDYPPGTPADALPNFEVCEFAIPRCCMLAGCLLEAYTLSSPKHTFFVG